LNKKKGDERESCHHCKRDPSKLLMDLNASSHHKINSHQGSINQLMNERANDCAQQIDLPTSKKIAYEGAGEIHIFNEKKFTSEVPQIVEVF